MKFSLRARLALSVFSVPLILGGNDMAWASSNEPNEYGKRDRIETCASNVPEDDTATKRNKGFLEQQQSDNNVEEYTSRSAGPKGTKRERQVQAEKGPTNLKSVKVDGEGKDHALEQWAADVGACKIMFDEADTSSSRQELLTLVKELPSFTLQRYAAWNRQVHLFEACHAAQDMLKLCCNLAHCSDFMLEVLVYKFSVLDEDYKKSRDGLDRMLADLAKVTAYNRDRLIALKKNFAILKSSILNAGKDAALTTSQHSLALYKLMDWLAKERTKQGQDRLDMCISRIEDFVSLKGKVDPRDVLAYLKGMLDKESYKDKTYRALSEYEINTKAIDDFLGTIFKLNIFKIFVKLTNLSEIVALGDTTGGYLFEQSIIPNLKKLQERVGDVSYEHIYRILFYMEAFETFKDEDSVTEDELSHCIEMAHEKKTVLLLQEAIKHFSPTDTYALIGSVVDIQNKQDRERLVSWLDSSGLMQKFLEEERYRELLGHSLESVERTFMWLQGSGIDNRNNQYLDIAKVMLNLEADHFPKLINWLRTNRRINPGFVDVCLKNLEARGDIYKVIAKASLSQEKITNLGLDKTDSSLYLTMRLLTYAYIEQNSTLILWLEECLAQHAGPNGRGKILTIILDILGQDHPLTQHCLMYALGLDNQQDPNGFLAIHQEMMRKSGEEVVHPEFTLTEGCRHNVNVVKELRPARPIHMPVNAWNHLFEKAKAMDHTALKNLIGDTSLDQLWALQGEQMLTSLLDPLDSLRTTPNVSGHSQMLRTVLKNIQDTQNMETFIQLLVNVLTCKTGKMNGIMHSYIYITENRVLDESELGTEAFKTHILEFFKADLRKFREVCITHVVNSVTNKRDPHDNHYVRGIIGQEVGLFLPNEQPVVDFNANSVNKNLRGLSKQDLLNRFYGYYSVEEVINRVHTKLNNGSIKVADENLANNLTAKVIGAYLKDDALDENGDGFETQLIVTDQAGDPVGLTPKAAELLLKQLGILLDR